MFNKTAKSLVVETSEVRFQVRNKCCNINTVINIIIFYLFELLPCGTSVLNIYMYNTCS